jgi:hypothetical protein
MNFNAVSDTLAPHGLREPVLNALVPNEDNYTVLLMQPNGQLEVSADGVRNRDRDLAERQFRSFLDDAINSSSDLVVTPEYAMPWSVLVETIKTDKGPLQGKIWALGCEAIKYSELEVIKNDLAPFATLLYENLAADPNRFFSPLAYVFKAQEGDGGQDERTVVLVQFKTHPMGDPNHFEINGMQRGSCVYQFGGNGENLKLVSLICADAFAFEDGDARLIHSRALVLHLQLNREPRHERFLGCRQRLLGFNGDETEVLCLNWARNVQMWRGDSIVDWENIAGSAWYLKSKDFDNRDTTLRNSHVRGFYYTWLKSLRAHAMFFNFEPATYQLNATKVAHVGVMGAVSKRRGPQLIKTCKWAEEAGVWQDQATSDDGFLEIVEHSGGASEQLQNIADENPFKAERILALSSGRVRSGIDWHEISNLDSCIIESSEVIRRLTFCQDTDQSAADFRISHLLRLRHLWRILQTEDLSPALNDFEGGFSLNWSHEFPHQNARSADGQRATLVYMGEDSYVEQVEETVKKIADYLFRTAPDADQSRFAQQRLAVWFRDENGEIELYDPHRYVKIDQTGEFSEFDIGREE